MWRSKNTSGEMGKKMMGERGDGDAPDVLRNILRKEAHLKVQ